MRKKWTAFLCAILCMALFAGCSPTEVGYLQMSKEVMQEMKQCEAKGSMEVTIDFNELKSMVEKTADAAGMPEEKKNEVLQSFQDLHTKEQVKLDYAMTMEMDTLEYVINADATYKGEKYPLGKLYFSPEKGMVVSADAVDNFNKILGKMTGRANTLYQNKEFAKEWYAYLDQAGYIVLADTEEMMAMPAMNTNQLTEAILSMYEKGFSGFTTGMVSEVPGGYHISANGTQIKEMLLNLIQYTAENPVQVLEAIEGYLQAVLEMSGEWKENEQDFTAAFAEMKANPEEVKIIMAQAKGIAKVFFENQNVAMWLNGFSYEGDVVKKDTGYEAKEQYLLKNGGNTVLQITSVQTTQKAKEGVTFPDRCVSMDEFAQKAQEIIGKYNPVTAVSVVWHPAKKVNVAIISVDRAEDFFLSADDGSIMQYQVVDGRVHLPAREFLQKIGLEMNWDKAARKAYVVKDGKTISVETRLIDGVSYMSMRELQKLGYKVSYTKADGEHTVSIAA